MSRKGRRGRGHKSAAGILCTLTLVVQLSHTITGKAVETAAPGPIEWTLATVRECMAKSPAPWPQAWQEEYLETIRQAVVGHQEASEYAVRLQILRNGFGPYWEGLRKTGERSLFEVHQAEIRWYVENLMAAELLGPEERQKLREQFNELMDHAADALVAQFPFLDPNLVQAAKADYLSECYRHIEAPLLPIFRHPLPEEQADQLRERWHTLRYARVDLWRQLGGKATPTGRDQGSPSGRTHPDYLLAQRSLAQWQLHIWAIVAPAPDYYRSALDKDIDTQRRRSQARFDAANQERRLPLAVLQTEYLRQCQTITEGFWAFVRYKGCGHWRSQDEV